MHVINTFSIQISICTIAECNNSVIIFARPFHTLLYTSKCREISLKFFSLSYRYQKSRLSPFFRERSEV